MIRAIKDRAGVVFAVHVQPRSSHQGVQGVHGEELKVAVTVPPEAGKANRAVVAVLAQWLGVRRAEVEVLSGHASRTKRVRVTGASPDRIIARLQEAGGSSS